MASGAGSAADVLGLDVGSDDIVCAAAMMELRTPLLRGKPVPERTGLSERVLQAVQDQDGRGWFSPSYRTIDPV